MNAAPDPASSPKSVPNFSSLFWVDYPIRRSVTATVAGLLIAVGIWWASRPMPNLPPPPEPSFESMYAPRIIVGGLVLSLIGGLFLLRRYLLVRKILTQGTPITGTAAVVDIFDTNQKSDSSTNKFSKTYAYYVTIRYEIHGTERKARFKLPHSPSTYGIRKDAEVALIVHDQAPKKPLIRALYVDQSRRARRFF
ncbi:MAG: hypothetical protein KDL87_08115 [Verrucomicrobiae bacterium]|nr:hypothetical protein [Verrucomicrobiae bacterium]